MLFHSWQRVRHPCCRCAESTCTILPRHRPWIPHWNWSQLLWPEITPWKNFANKKYFLNHKIKIKIYKFTKLSEFSLIFVTAILNYYLFCRFFDEHYRMGKIIFLHCISSSVRGWFYCTAFGILTNKIYIV